MYTGYAGTFYTNPVVEDNHPDPGVLKLPDDQGFVAVTTSNYDREGIDPIFPILYSEDLVSWEQVSMYICKRLDITCKEQSLKYTWLTEIRTLTRTQKGFSM